MALALKRVEAQADRMTDAYRNEAIELPRYKVEMQELRRRREALLKRQGELAEEQQAERAVLLLTGFCEHVAVGIDALTFEERQQLLRLVVDRVLIDGQRVQVKTVIPLERPVESTYDEQGLLRTRHPERSEESGRGVALNVPGLHSREVGSVGLSLQETPLSRKTGIAKRKSLDRLPQIARGK